MNKSNYAKALNEEFQKEDSPLASLKGLLEIEQETETYLDLQIFAAQDVSVRYLNLFKQVYVGLFELSSFYKNNKRYVRFTKPMKGYILDKSYLHKISSIYINSENYSQIEIAFYQSKFHRPIELRHMFEKEFPDMNVQCLLYAGEKFETLLYNKPKRFVHKVNK